MKRMTLEELARPNTPYSVTDEGVFVAEDK